MINNLKTIFDQRTQSFIVLPNLLHHIDTNLIPCLLASPISYGQWVTPFRIQP